MMDLDGARSCNDDKNYRIINTSSGLECLLVSTKLKCEKKGETDTKATAAMAVQVGSFADPAVAEGCAHFLEHMVFMGSTKYPGENYYDSFVTSRGGSCNAFTEGEYTAYQFDVSAEHFAETLDIFGNCFIAPLLAPSAVDREINAIDSEFNLAQTDDGSRMQQLYCHQARGGHILRKFSWGNLKSLKTAPEQQGVDVRAILRDFHSTHYHPENMKLVVLAPQSLDELAALVHKSFGTWENPHATVSRARKMSGGEAQEAKKLKTENDGIRTPSVSQLNLSSLPLTIPVSEIDTASATVASNLPSLDACIVPFQGAAAMDAATLSKLTRVVPLKSAHKLMLVWQLPSYCREYRSKPCSYIGHALGHEGAGSVLSHLKKLNYATGLAGGVSESNFDDNSMFTLFEVCVTLTERGLANWMYVAEVIHKYLRMLRSEGPQKRIFDELQQVCNLNYRYLDEEEPSDYAERLAIEMLPLHARQPRGDILGAAHLLWDWRPDLVQNILDDYLTVRGAKVTLSSSIYRAPTAPSGPKEAFGGKATAEGVTGAAEDDGSDCSGGDESDGASSDADAASQGEEEDSVGDGGNDSGSGSDAEGDEDSGEGSDEEEDDEAASQHSEDAAEELDAILDNVRAQFAGPEGWLQFVLPPDEGDHPPSTEPHFGTVYWEDAIPADMYALWEGKTETSDQEVACALHLPLPNPYIATNLEMIEVGASSTPTASLNDAKIPERIVIEAQAGPWQGSSVVLWHLPDVSFASPKVEIGLRVVSPLACADVESAVLTELLGKLLYERLNEETYMAAMAELYCNVRLNDIGIKIDVSGFSDKACLLTTSAVQALLRFVEKFPAEPTPEDLTIFSRLREMQLRGYQNATLKAKHSAETARLCALKPSKFHPDDKLAALQAHTAAGELALDYRALQSFAQRFLSAACLEFVIQGNLTGTAAVDLVHAVLGTGSGPTSTVPGDGAQFSPRFLPGQVILQIPANKAVVLRKAPRNPLESNACVEVYFQWRAWSLAEVTLLDLLEQLVQEPFFDDLRTQQQLGYSVSCGVRQTYGTLGFCFQVVASKFPAEALIAAVFKFVAEIPDKIIGGYTPEKYLDNLRALRSIKRTPEQSLNEAARNLREEIEEAHGCLHCAAKQAALLDGEDSYRQDKMVEFSRSVFLQAPRLMVVQSTLAQTPPLETLPAPFDNCEVLCVSSDIAEVHRLLG